jgi:hypothetical protein
MIAFKFPTQITNSGDLLIPSHYRQSIPAGSQLQVVLLVELPTTEEFEATDETLSLNEYVALLRSRPLPSTVITPASDSLGDHLARPLHDAQPDFNESAWNQQWDQIETDKPIDKDFHGIDAIQHENWRLG